MLSTSRDLFFQWNDANVSYCHWKSNEHLMAGLDGDTDLDILMSKKDYKCSSSILRQLNFIKCHSQFGSRYPNVEDWVGFDKETGKLLHVHLHFALITGHTGLKEYALPWLNEALETRKKDEETKVFVIEPELELLSLYSRLILKSSSSQYKAAKGGTFTLSEHFDREINYVKRQVNWRRVEALVSTYFGSYSVAFLNVVKSETMTASRYIQLHQIVLKNMRSHARYHGLRLYVLRFFYINTIRILSTIKNKTHFIPITRKVVNPYKGLSIAFVGQDGSGKSTVTQDIQKWLLWKLEAYRFYLGSGDHYNGIIKRLVQKRHIMQSNSNSSKTTSASEKQKMQVNTSCSFAKAVVITWQMLAVSRRAYKEIQRAAKYCKKGGIALFDRFPQNQFAGVYDGPKIADWCEKSGYHNGLFKWLAKREQNYINRSQQMQPELVFKLQLTPEESIRRKPNDNADNIYIKHQITNSLVFPNSKVITINAEQEYQKELIEIKNAIWEQLIQIQ